MKLVCIGQTHGQYQKTLDTVRGRYRVIVHKYPNRERGQSGTIVWFDDYDRARLYYEAIVLEGRQ